LQNLYHFTTGLAKKKKMETEATLVNLHKHKFNSTNVEGLY